MMDHFALDPYEQQLLKVFDSHDREHCGSLDRDGLIQLCQTLQLEEQGTELVKCLLKNKHSRATFTEFKDALLALLGNMQNSKNNKNEDIISDCEKTSPEREVSPKFVYGSKKYGRRSRPRKDEVNTNIDDSNDTCSNRTLNGTPVQRSNSQIEVSYKKRKTNYQLKRCTSLPGNNALMGKEMENSFLSSHTLSNEPELICTEEMLREAWRKLGVGENGYLNQTELILVCDAIGLHKLAPAVIRQLSDKLSVNYDHKISFQELMLALQQDETWFEVLNETSPDDDTIPNRANDKLFPDSRTFQFVTLGPDRNGIVSADVLIEMWENVGIHSPKELLHELGFNSRQISVIELAEVLEKHIKGISESTRSEYQNPHLTLLQANLTLYQSEIKCFKVILEQMHAEREKLKCDVLEANNRSTLLAQEVDDNHLRMEQNTLNQVKLLEQRHSDILKDVTSQFSKDKEHLTSINRNLEERIYTLEQESTKLKNDLLIAQKYSINVEKENQLLNSKIQDLQSDKDTLANQIGLLECEKQKFSEIGQEENQILITKLNVLQIENSKLKDRNDEMESEIESLSNQVASIRMKNSSTPTPSMNTLDQSMEENISIICEGVGIGAKRRSDYSPSKDVHLFGLADGSPRLGKIRKFHKNRGGNLEVPFTSSESGFDTEVECFDSSLSISSNDCDEITRLQAKILFLEQVLVQNGISLPNYDSKDNGGPCIITSLNKRVRALEQLIREVKQDIRRMIERDCVNCDSLTMVTQKLEHSTSNLSQSCEILHALPPNFTEVGSQTDFINSFEEKVKKLEVENAELCNKCNELENCVELLRNEYEKCEDYWQKKVDDERQMFEAEQKVNSDELADLIQKMKEYEEQFANQESIDNRLPTIEETYNLEKQFTDLELEFEQYKAQSETELFKKDEEIAILKQKLTEFAIKQVNEIAVQVEEAEELRILNKMQSCSTYVIETTSRFSDEMLPPKMLPTSTPNNVAPATWQSQSLPNSKPEQPALSINSNSVPINWNFSKDTGDANAPSTSSSSLHLEKNSTPCRPKRTRKHDKNLYKKNQDRDVKKTEINKNPQGDIKAFGNLKSNNIEQTIMVPLSSFHNLNGRKNYLEQRVRHLQTCIKQQHYCSEQTLQHYWLQFKGERADLHSKMKFLQEKLDQQIRICNEQLNKLERTDVLVKDLYIENSYLIANVQRLEQQCRMLARCNSNSSSV